MCTVLGVARSTYYKSFDKTKSKRDIENDELKAAIKRIYQENRGIYGTPRIHHILGKEGFNVFLKRVQRKMGRRYYIYSYSQRWVVLFSFSSRFIFKKNNWLRFR